jgi:hypothetical protein
VLHPLPGDSIPLGVESIKRRTGASWDR